MGGSGSKHPGQVRVAKSHNLYGNHGAVEAINIVDTDIAYPAWEKDLLPPILRSDHGLKDSYPGVLANGEAVKIPSLLPVDLKLNERIQFDRLEEELLNYFNGLFSLGYRHMQFTIIRPFVETSYVSPGAITGGIEDLLANAEASGGAGGNRNLGELGELAAAGDGTAGGGTGLSNLSHLAKHKDSVKVLYWAIALEGEVAELQDELSAFKKQIEHGNADPDHVYRQMRRKKWQEAKIKQLRDWVHDFEANRQKRGRRAVTAIDLVWNYEYIHRARRKNSASGNINYNTSGHHQHHHQHHHHHKQEQRVRGDHTSSSEVLRENATGLSVVFAIREMYYYLLKESELQVIRDNKDLQMLGSSQKASGGQTVAFVDEDEKAPDVPTEGIRAEDMLPFVTVEKAENESVKDFLHSAHISLLRDRVGRMVRCLKIAADMLQRCVRTDDVAVQRIFWSLDTDLRELFVIGAKQRLRDLYALFDKGLLDSVEFGHKVEQMAFQIGEFIDTVVLPCLSYRDCTIEIETRDDLHQLTRHLDQRCFVTDAFSYYGDEFGKGDFVKVAGSQRNAKMRATGVISQEMVDQILVRELRKSAKGEGAASSSGKRGAAGDGAPTSPSGGGAGAPGDVGGGGAAAGGGGNASAGGAPGMPGAPGEHDVDPTGADDLAAITTSTQAISSGSYMSLANLTARTPVPCEIMMTRNTTEQNLELIAKWVCWKADWYRYLCVMAMHHDLRQIEKNSILARFCYTESIRLARVWQDQLNQQAAQTLSINLVGGGLPGVQLSYEFLVSHLNFACYFASVERNYERARAVCDAGVRWVERGEDQKLPKMRILIQNLYRLQRTLYSHMVVMSITIADWDVLTLLNDGVATATETQQEDAEEAAGTQRSTQEAVTKIQTPRDGSVLQDALDDNRREGGTLWRQWKEMCCGPDAKTPRIPGDYGPEDAVNTARREFTRYDAKFVASALVGSVHEKEKTFRTPCRLKIVARLIMWIIRRRHRYAMKRWFRDPKMVDMGKDLGVFWLDHIDRDEHFSGRRYFLAARFNPMLFHMAHAPQSVQPGGPGLGPGGSEQGTVLLEPFSWIGQAVVDRNGRPTADNPFPTMWISKADVLGSVPFAEVHQFFRGLDGERMTAVDRFFNLPHFLDQHCRAWAFIARRKVKKLEGLGKNLRNLSVRRHPIRALQSGPA